jgi:alanine dehydrogenase
MNIGVIKQTRNDERRVPMVPAGVHLLTQRGHVIYIEHDAGLAAGFDDTEYREAGGNVVYSRAEAIGRSALVLGVAPFQLEDAEMFVSGQTVMSFGHLSASTFGALRRMVDKNITAIAYELIENDDKRRPIVEVMGEVAGPITMTLAARFLESHHGGRGVLLSGLPGIPPAHVVVIGGGAVGMAAARAALGMGAHVTLFDSNPDKLRRALERLGGHLTTLLSYRYNLERVLPTADVVIGAVWLHGQKPPVLITTDIVRKMKSRSVIIDCSIDQGGICATGRPTTLSDPVYVAEGVVHCCVPNLPSAVARTSSHALANALFPYVRRFAEGGIDALLSEQARFAEGVYLREGRAAHPVVAELLNQKAPLGANSDPSQADGGKTR